MKKFTRCTAMHAGSTYPTLTMHAGGCKRLQRRGKKCKKFKKNKKFFYLGLVFTTHLWYNGLGALSSEGGVQ